MRRRPPPRSVDELHARAGELADVFERFEPHERERGEPPLTTVRRLAHRLTLVERELLAAVSVARSAGVSWSSIGRELETSGEAARQRYGVVATPERDPAEPGGHRST